jgi:hypothetical protein
MLWSASPIATDSPFGTPATGVSVSTQRPPASPATNGELLIFPSGYVVVVLANLDPPAATEVARFVAARLPLE